VPKHSMRLSPLLATWNDESPASGAFDPA
jgi:hypothetical protein